MRDRQGQRLEAVRWRGHKKNDGSYVCVIKHGRDAPWDNLGRRADPDGQCPEQCHLVLCALYHRSLRRTLRESDSARFLTQDCQMSKAFFREKSKLSVSLFWNNEAVMPVLTFCRTATALAERGGTRLPERGTDLAFTVADMRRGVAASGRVCPFSLTPASCLPVLPHTVYGTYAGVTANGFRPENAYR